MNVRLKVEQVADGLVFPEGPVWHPDGFLLFSDVHGGTIQRLLEPRGTETWWAQGKKTNGLIMSPDGTRIYACCYSDRTLLEIDALGKSYRVVAERCGGRNFLNVNDVAVALDGTIYFSDPCWDPAHAADQGVYKVTPDGEVALAVSVEKQPNGLVVSPDQEFLFVARSGAHDILRFRRTSRGELESPETWVELPDGSEPDGMTIDRAGNLYVALAGTGELAIVGHDAKLIHIAQICGRMATNCEFQGANESILYVTGGGRREGHEGGVWRVEIDGLPRCS